MIRTLLKMVVALGLLCGLMASCTHSSAPWVPKPCRQQNLEATSHLTDLKRKSAIAPEISYPALSAPLEPQSLDKMPLLMAHYLPWFQTPEISGYWGNHWTMNTCNPDQFVSPERRDICSHYYPLIGPYDSSDPDLLEYHMLLMRLSGIDGILLDWYGIQPYYDWPVLKEASDKIMQAFNARGFKVGIVYEDRTIRVAMARGLITDPILSAQQDIDYLEKHYFSLENYIHVQKTPLLLNFGPSYFVTAEGWQHVFAADDQPPRYSGLSYLCGVSFTNYPWIEFPHTPDYLQQYYAWIHWAELPYSIGSAYPGFHDYYQQGGWGENLYYLDDEGGQRFSRTLALNLEYAPDIIQLNTWNDWGEGTMLEPSIESGYRYLEDLQAIKGLSFNASDLELATQLYKLRKQHQTDEGFQHQLDQVAEHLFNAQISQAQTLLAGVHR